MSNIPTARFVVRRCDTERIEGDETISVFLVPQTAEYDSDEDDDPVENVLFEVKQSVIPSDIAFVRVEAEETGEFKEEGVWLIVPEVIPPGTVVDLQLHVVGVRA